jgi:hypothetical protein
MERRIVAQLLTCLDELGKGENQVPSIGKKITIPDLEIQYRYR